MQRNSFAGRRRKRFGLIEKLECRQLLAAIPVANDDTLLATSSVPVIVDFLLANDLDADGDPLSIVSHTDPSGGTLTDNGDGTFTYSPNSGFVGTDSFRYTVDDGVDGTSVATVHVTVSAVMDPNAARTQIMAGVTQIHGGVQPGRLVAFGPQAYVIADYPGELSEGPMIAAASLGSGRVLAVPDHQALNFDTFANSGNSGRFYRNGLAWVANDTSRTIDIVTLRQGTADWLVTQGYSNVTVGTDATLATDLQGADVLVGWLGDNQSQPNLDAIEAFVIDGGGLFIAEYGAGYTFWWNKPQHEAPGNILLRSAGIGFPDNIRFDNDLVDASNRPDSDINSDDLLAMLNDSTGWTPRQLERAAVMMGSIFGVLPPTDSLYARLDSEFQARISSINPTPDSPVTDGFDKALLTEEMRRLQRLPAGEVTAHRTVDAVYGAVPADAERVSDTVTIDTTISRWHSTGLYVAPGEVATVTVPPSLVSSGYRIRISGHRDNISARDSWDRVPFGVSRTYDIDSETIDIAGAFGGAIYVDVGSTPPNIGEVEVAISGAVRAPLFVLGETTGAQWVASIRDNPAPYAEFVSPHVAMSVPSDWIRTLANPEALMSYWDEAGARQDYVGGQEQFRTGPERFNVDVQISIGLLHSGYPIQGPTWASQGLVDYPALLTSGNWGYFHELGHEAQRRPDKAYGRNAYTFSDGVEVTVNIFANASLEQQVPSPPTAGWGWSAYPAEVMLRAISEVNDSSSPTFTDKFQYPHYFALADEFGWEGYRTVLSTYHADFAADPTSLPSTDTEKKDEWLLRWSREMNFDLTRFMVDHWGLEVSAAGRSAVAALNLPDWMPLVGQDDTAIYRPGEAVSFNVLENDLALDGVVSLDSFTAPAEGALVHDGNGLFTYTAESHQSSPISFTYSVANSTGQTDTQTVVLDRARPVSWWKFNENSGTLAADASGNGNDGLVEGPLWTEGLMGSALDFDGVDDKVTFGTGPSLEGTTDFTVAAWIRTQATSNGVIIQQRNGGFNGEYKVTVRSNGRVEFFLYGNSAYQFNMTSTTAVNDGRWHHIAAVRDGETGLLYIDGVEAATATGTVRDLRSTIGVGIGADIRSDSEYFAGSIDDVRIYDTALSVSEIVQMMVINQDATGTPTVTGEPLIGETLTADTANIMDADGLGDFQYQWLREGTPIVGANAATYLLVDDDEGRRIAVEVRFNDLIGSPEGPLASEAVLATRTPNVVATGRPTISGAAQVGELLSAETIGIADDNGLGTFRYQWLRNGQSVIGATGSTYFLSLADEGSRMSVSVSFVDNNGAPEGPLTSDETTIVTIAVVQPPINLSVSSNSIDEGDSVTVTASMAQPASQDVIVTLGFAGSANTDDYTASPTVLTIIAGETLATSTIGTVDDDIAEPNETLTINMNSIIGTFAGTTTTQTIFINNNDSQPSVSIDVSETQVGESDGKFTIVATLTNESVANVIVPIVLTGTADEEDYTLAASRITIPAGSLRRTITVDIVNDLAYEDDETIIVATGDIIGAQSDGASPKTITIADNDSLPNVFLRLTSSSIDETSGELLVGAISTSRSSFPVTIDLSFAGTAGDADFEFMSENNRITIQPGETTADVLLRATDDDFFEGDETVVMMVDTVIGGNFIGVRTLTGTIVDDDPQPTVTLDVDTGSIDEDNGTATVTATLSSLAGIDVTVNLATSGSATLTDDFLLDTSPIIIKAGESSATAELSAIGDGDYEDNETIEITLGDVVGATAEDFTSHSVSIVDDDSPPSVSLGIDSATINESAGEANITATLNGISWQPVTIDLNFGGSATGNSTDYETSANRITIDPGNLTGSILITGRDDVISEGPEIVEISQTNVFGATFTSQDPLVITIVDDETTPTVNLSVDSLSIDEADGTATFTATLSAVVSSDVVVRFSQTGDAEESEDYSIDGTLITITAGDTEGTVVVTTVDDDLDEFDESIVLAIDSVTGAVAGSNSISSVAVKDDDDLPTFSLSSDNVVISENGGAATISATLSERSGRDVIIPLSLGGTAGTDDYDFPVSQILVRRGDLSGSVDIAASVDRIDEDTETVLITADNVAHATQSEPFQLAVDISDGNLPPEVTLSNNTNSIIEGGAMTITATLAEPSGLDVVVDLQIVGSASASDIETHGSQILIEAGEISGSFHLMAVQDLIDEETETIEVSVLSIENGTTGEAFSESIEIVDTSDAPDAIASLQQSIVIESGGETILNVSLSAVSERLVTIEIIPNGDAILGSDYELSSQSILIHPGETLGEVTVAAKADAIYEGDETVELTLRSPNGSVNIIEQPGVITLLQGGAAPQVTLTLDKIQVPEAAGVAIISAELDTRVSQDVTVSLAFAGIEADDFSVPQTSITIPAGELTGAMQINILDDSIYEADEVLQINIESVSPPFQTIVDSSSLEIVDDDSGEFEVVVGANPIEVNETGASATVEVRLLNEPSENVVLSIASGNEDEVVAVPNSITFTSGNWQTAQAITIYGVGDTTDDGDKEVAVTVSVNKDLSDPGFAATEDFTIEVVNRNYAFDDLEVMEQDGEVVIRDRIGGGMLRRQPTGDTNEVLLDLSGTAKRLGVGTFETFAGTIALRHQSDDSIEFGADWRNMPQALSDGVLTHVLHRGDVTLEIVNDLPYTNPLDRYDANRDGNVNSLDALVTINQLNRGGSGDIAYPPDDVSIPRFYYDVNRDQAISSIDALQVINRLTRQPSAEGSAFPADSDHAERHRRLEAAAIDLNDLSKSSAREGILIVGVDSARLIRNDAGHAKTSDRPSDVDERSGDQIDHDLLDELLAAWD